MEVADRLAGLTAPELAPVVRRALDDDGAWPTTWEATSLAWVAANPVTLGLYRLTGSARLGGGGGRSVDWAAMLKVVGDVDPPGAPVNLCHQHDPQGFNYWRREALAFRSGLLEGWPGPLLPVRCLGVDETEPGVSWIWLEAHGGLSRRRGWTLDEQALLAHDLGALAAQWADRPPSVVRHPWLVQRWLRSWLRFFDDVGVAHVLAHDGCWEHPLVAAALPAGTRARVTGLLAAAEQLLPVLESLPTTLAHHDTQASNFFLRDPADSDSRTVAIDWAFAGLAPVGHDLGCHLWSNLCTWTVDPRDALALDRLSTAAYFAGLRDSGWSGDDRAVLFARAVAGSLATVAMLTQQIGALCDGLPGYARRGRWPEDLADQQQLSTREVMSRWAAGFRYALDLGDEARRLGGQVGCRR